MFRLDSNEYKLASEALRDRETNSPSPTLPISSAQKSRGFFGRSKKSKAGTLYEESPVSPPSNARHQRYPESRTDDDAKLVKQLQSMGFSNRQLILEALVKSKGDIVTAIDYMTAEDGKNRPPLPPRPLSEERIGRENLNLNGSANESTNSFPVGQNPFQGQYAGMTNGPQFLTPQMTSQYGQYAPQQQQIAMQNYYPSQMQSPLPTGFQSDFRFQQPTNSPFMGLQQGVIGGQPVNGVGYPDGQVMNNPTGYVGGSGGMATGTQQQFAPSQQMYNPGMQSTSDNMGNPQSHFTQPQQVVGNGATSGPPYQSSFGNQQFASQTSSQPLQMQPTGFAPVGFGQAQYQQQQQQYQQQHQQQPDQTQQLQSQFSQQQPQFPHQPLQQQQPMQYNATSSVGQGGTGYSRMQGQMQPQQTGARFDKYAILSLYQQPEVYSSPVAIPSNFSGQQSNNGMNQGGMNQGGMGAGTKGLNASEDTQKKEDVAEPGNKNPFAVKTLTRQVDTHEYGSKTDDSNSGRMSPDAFGELSAWTGNSRRW